MAYLGPDYKACVPPREAFLKYDGFDRYYINRVNAVIHNTKTDRVVKPLKNPTSSGNFQVEFTTGVKNEKPHPLIKDLLYATWIGPIPDDCEVVITNGSSEVFGVQDVKLVNKAVAKQEELAARKLALMQSDEDWRQHPVAKNYYATAAGQIFSLFVNKIIEGHRRVQDDYIEVELNIGAKKPIKKGVHIFVWECFNQQQKPASHDIHHKNNLVNDNKLSNLESLSRAAHNKVTAASSSTRSTALAAQQSIRVKKIVTGSDGTATETVYASKSQAVEDNGYVSRHIIDDAIFYGTEVEAGVEWVLDRNDEDLPDEEWRSFAEEGYPKCKVSNYGRIDNDRHGKHFPTAAKSRQEPYLKVDGVGKDVKHIVCKAFVPVTDASLTNVERIDKKAEFPNAAANLRWSSQKTQAAGGKNAIYCFYEINPRYGELYKQYQHAQEAADEFHVNRSSVSNAARGASTRDKFSNGRKRGFCKTADVVLEERDGKTFVRLNDNAYRKGDKRGKSSR